MNTIQPVKSISSPVDRAAKVTLNRHRRMAAERLLKLLVPKSRDDVVHYEARPGDKISDDPVVAACEGPLGHTRYGFLLGTELPNFASLLRPKAKNMRGLQVVESEFAEVAEAYGNDPGKWFLGLIVETGGNFYLYTDQPLGEEYPGLSHLKFSDARGDRTNRFIASLDAFAEAASH